LAQADESVGSDAEQLPDGTVPACEQQRFS
jgi:hypothetical protein